MRIVCIIFAVVLLVAGAAAFVYYRPHRAQPPVELVNSMHGSAMGSHWTVKLGKPLEPKVIEQHKQKIQAILDRIDGVMSTWKPSSDVSRFNANRSDEWIAVPSELASLVEESLKVSDQTNGAFDITVAPLVNLWGFGPVSPGPGGRRVPADDAIAAAKARVGYKQLEARIKPPALRKLDPDLMIDLSAIAQGYASDQVAAYLDGAGIIDYMVDCGELRARGSSPRGVPWKVGIQNPTPDTLRTLGGVELKDTSMATSGDYRNFFEQDGKRYSHEIDPRTGRPIVGNLASVIVHHPSASYADAMATAMMVLGPEEGFATAERLNLAALFVIRGDGRFEFKQSSRFPPILHGHDDSPMIFPPQARPATLPTTRSAS
jgi:thiamine biosynthesis lipoprotein